MLKNIKLIETRNKFVNLLLSLAILISIPLIVISLFRGFRTGFQVANYIHLIIFFLFLLIFIFKKKISYNIKTGIMLSTVFISGVVGIYSYATLSTDFMTLLFFVFLSTILFGRKIGFISLLLSTSLVLVYAFLFTSNTIKLNVNPYTYIDDISSWLDIVISFILFSIIILFLVNRFYEELHKIITELESKKIKLKIEKERLAATFTSINESIITTNAKGMITFVNKQAEKLTAYDSNDLINKGMNVFEILNENTSEKIENIFELILKDKLKDIRSIILVNKKKENLNIVFSASLIKDFNEKIVGTIIVFRDVSENRRKQKEVLKLKKLESVGYLAGGIAHDFNNLLLGIVGNLDLAQLELENDNISVANKNINISLKACMKATYLTHKLLTFSKGGNPIKEAVSVSQIINNSLLILPREVVYSSSIPKDLWLINADRSQISQVIQVFISNSIESIKNSGELSINCINKEFSDEGLFISKGKYVEITIRDNGIGIKKENIDKIFDPYFTTKGEGRGLGLSIAHSIVSNHNGYIVFDPEIRTGSCFIIYIPAIEDSFKKQKTNILLKSSDIIEPVKQRKKVLIMDDEEMIRTILTKVLTKLNYDVIATKTGEEAISSYKEHKYEFSIFDITIPDGMNGDKAASIILDFDKDAKIIASSGYSTYASIRGYKEIGFLDFIPKPYRIQELRDKINSIYGNS